MVQAINRWNEWESFGVEIMEIIILILNGSGHNLETSWILIFLILEINLVEWNWNGLKAIIIEYSCDWKSEMSNKLSSLTEVEIFF